MVLGPLFLIFRPSSVLRPWSAAAVALCIAFPGTTAFTRDVTRETSREIKQWSMRLIERTHGPANSDALLLDLIVIDAAGKRWTLAHDLIGPIIVFERERRIVSCESESAMSGVQPKAFELSGRMIEGPKHPGYVRQCTRIEDSNLVLLHYNLMKSGQPYNFVRVINTDGKVVLEKELVAAATINVLGGVKTYRVRIPEPQLPG